MRHDARVPRRRSAEGGERHGNGYKAPYQINHGSVRWRKYRRRTINLAQKYLHIYLLYGTVWVHDGRALERNPMEGGAVGENRKKDPFMGLWLVFDDNDPDVQRGGNGSERRWR